MAKTPATRQALHVHRRTILKALPVGLAAAVGARLTPDPAGAYGMLRWWAERRLRSLPAEPVFDPVSDEGAVSSLDKIRDFDRTYADDYVVVEHEYQVLLSSAARLERAQKLVGFGNFNLLSFDRLLSFANNYPEIGSFTPAELDLLDELFHADATRYCFYGEKVLTEKDAEIRKRDVTKIAGSGHYLLNGEPLEKFRRIRRDVGPSIVLTSGVRAMAKQYQLVLSKAVETGGNLSQASRSLAPPGYSFHARGDFDLGKQGFGGAHGLATSAR